MADVRIRHAHLYVNGKRCAEVQNTKESRKSGDEAQIGDLGYIGHSDGAETCTITATAIHPVGGMAIPDLQKLMSSKTRIDVVVSSINGSIHQFRMAITQADTDSESKTGSQMGTYTFESGPPKII